MDQATLVADGIGAGQVLIEHLRASAFVVKDAFWAYDPDDDQSYLFLVSPYVDRHGGRKAYILVQEVIRRLPSWRERSPLDVKILGAKDLVARAIAADIESHSDQQIMLLRYVSGFYRNGVHLKQVWIYPRKTH